eukprot:TRINITY_DN91343_c0_g1_i1.p1 TRINITY_DN91343_c0_g1~~TRINITY_DN91343_c0_g1_i1.p1  ORF type:complete len:367 (+),score=61.13 TRINITY_DN91343_c0_g1_i1:34-1134(+)
MGSLMRPLLVILSVGRTACQLKRLRVWNSCEHAPIWIAHEAAAGAVGPSPQNVRIEPGKGQWFNTPDGLTGTRYWPKMFCNEDGDDCLLGGSGGPSESCVHGQDYSRCAPPIDTKFEATFGHSGERCDPLSSGGCDFIDISLVDGFTLPFKLTPWGGKCRGSKGLQARPIDCSGLTFGTCPVAEHMGHLVEDLRARNPKTGNISGCYSPCTKLTSHKWKNWVNGDEFIKPFCCPPGVQPEQCRAGGVGHSRYVAAIHQHCPGVYAYSYDDAMGLLQCEPSTHYELNFYCPTTMQNMTDVGRETQRLYASRESARLWLDHVGDSWALCAAALVGVIALALPLLRRLLRAPSSSTAWGEEGESALLVQ